MSEKGSEAWIAEQLNRFKILNRERKFEELEVVAQELEALLTEDNSLHNHAKLCAKRYRGYQLRLTASDEEVLAYFEAILDEAQQAGDPINEAYARVMIGISLTESGNAEKAIAYFEQALVFFQSTSDVDGQIHGHTNIAATRVRLADFEGAIRALLQALELAESINDKFFESRIWYTLAAPYYYMGDLAQALTCSLRSYTMSTEMGYADQAAENTNNIAYVSLEVGAFDIARRWNAITREFYADTPDSNEYVSAMIQEFEIQFRESQELVDLQAFEAKLLSVPRGLDFTTCIQSAAVVVRARFDRGDIEECRKHLDYWLPYAIEKNMHVEQLAMRIVTLACDVRTAPGIDHWDRYLDLLEQVRDLKIEDDEERLLKIAIEIQDRALDNPREALTLTHQYHTLRESRARKRSYNVVAMVDAEHRHDQAQALSQRQQDLLSSVMPNEIVERLMKGEQNIADLHDEASVMFLDLVSFTDLSASVPPAHLIHLLNAVFSACDDVVQEHGLTKIKTIGDSYMAVSGLPHAQEDHAQRMANAAMDMMSRLRDLQVHMPAELGDTSWVDDIDDLSVRIGLHCGGVVAGVIGKHRAQYDVWGDTVNTASRMESTGQPDRIHISEDFAMQLANGAAPEIDGTDIIIKRAPYQMRLRGTTTIKGKGDMKTFWLEAM